MLDIAALWRLDLDRKEVMAPTGKNTCHEPGCRSYSPIELRPSRVKLIFTVRSSWFKLEPSLAEVFCATVALPLFESVHGKAEIHMPFLALPHTSEQVDGA